MRSAFSILMLVCLLSAVHFQPSHSHLPPLLKGKGLGKGVYGKDAGGTALAAVISSRKFGLGLKAILFKPLLLVALAKIKFALLLGKPLALLAIKKLLLKAVLGKLLLKIPLILLKGKALLVKMLALKFALITKGLLGLKAPLAMLFLGACALGSGIGLAVALGATLHKLKEQESYEDDYSYEEPGYALPPPRPAYGPPAYSAPAPYSSASTQSSPFAYSPSAAYTISVPSYSQTYGGSPSNYASHVNSPAPNFGAASFGSGFSDFGISVGGSHRRKRDTENDSHSDSEDEQEEESGEDVDESEEETIDESPENLQLEFEAARSNGNAYLYMAAQFDEQSCGRRLMCEIYQKPHGSLTEDEILLQEIFGYPLSPLSEEDEGTPRETYYRAAQLGASYQGRASNKICARFYPTCPHDAEQLINIFVTEDVNTNEIDTENRIAVHLRPPQTSAHLPFYEASRLRSPITPAPALKSFKKENSHSESKANVALHSDKRQPVVTAATPLRHRFTTPPSA